jgi:hypothetical protein
MARNITQKTTMRNGRACRAGDPAALTSRFVIARFRGA